MEIRKFRIGEEEQLWKLFYDTIHNINIRDYDKDQIAVWAPKDIDMNFVVQKFRGIDPFVVIHNGEIVAYADIQPDGYIDHFFCHHEFQGMGIGTLLFRTLEKEARANAIARMYSNVSITARPFFQAMGFIVEKEQVLHMGDETLRNYRMIRDCSESLLQGD